MSTERILNYRKVDDLLITGGQPSAEQLRDAAAEGIVNVINLAPHESPHALDGEAGLVQSLGMRYFYIPVAWDNPTAADFAAFEQVMQARPAGKTLIHCMANFRVTAFYALYAQKHLGWSAERAEEFRASVWVDSDYPIWEAFIADMRAHI
jgi:protein tyrosine phosphatase (PTP) superfamily phosphohydrolase (DUF442 family)